MTTAEWLSLLALLFATTGPVGIVLALRRAGPDLSKAKREATAAGIGNIADLINSNQNLRAQLAEADAKVELLNQKLNSMTTQAYRTDRLMTQTGDGLQTAIDYIDAGKIDAAKALIAIVASGLATHPSLPKGEAR